MHWGPTDLHRTSAAAAASSTLSPELLPQQLWATSTTSACPHAFAYAQMAVLVCILKGFKPARSTSLPCKRFAAVDAREHGRLQVPAPHALAGTHHTIVEVLIEYAVRPTVPRGAVGMGCHLGAERVGEVGAVAIAS